MDFENPATSSNPCGADEAMMNRPSYCTSCRRKTEHANPPCVCLLRNGRPAHVSYCFFCHKKRIRFLPFNWFHAKTGKRVVLKKLTRKRR